MKSLVGIETFNVIKNGKIVSNLVKGKSLEFLKNKISKSGLSDFHLTLVIGLSDKEKLEYLEYAIKNWNNIGKKILSL